MPESKTTRNLLEKGKVCKARSEAIEVLANDLRTAYQKAKTLDLHYVMSEESISWSYDDYGDVFDAAIQIDPAYPGAHIHINTSKGNLEGSTRSRFSIAHELGHYCIHEHRSEILSGRLSGIFSNPETKTSDLLIEREANLFAASLLLPRDAFTKAIHRKSQNLHGIVAVAEQFDASVTCAAIRVADLEVFPCCLMMWGPDGLLWRWASHLWAAAGFRGKPIEKSSIPEDSATGETLQEEEVIGEIKQKGSVARSWFPSFPKGSKYDFVVNEEALSLGNARVVTLLTPHAQVDLLSLQKLASETLENW